MYECRAGGGGGRGGEGGRRGRRGEGGRKGRKRRRRGEEGEGEEEGEEGESSLMGDSALDVMPQGSERERTSLLTQLTGVGVGLTVFTK